MAVTFRSDEAIKTDILGELKWDSRVRSTEIGVTVKNGIVTLTGTVDSYLKKIAAQDASHSVRNVQAVVNDIEVHLLSASERTDTDLAEAILHALKWDTAIPTEAIDIIVDRGLVALKGGVRYSYQKRDAERVVARISGVRGVSNQIVIKASPVAGDLKHTIERALLRHAEYDAQQVGVEVDNGHVVLRGTIPSLAEKQAIERSVLFAPGVTSVENRLIVLPLLRFPEDKLDGSIETVLLPKLRSADAGRLERSGDRA